MRFYLLVILVYVTNINANLLTPGSWIDTFETLDTKRWTSNDDFLLCLRGKRLFGLDDECVYLTTKKLTFSSSKPGMMQIAFNNDCTGNKCCRKFLCSPFTTGNLKSIQKYGYGSFRWYATAIHDMSLPRSTVEVLSCFSLKNDPAEKIALVISICVSSAYPFVATTILQAGEYKFSERHSLPFDASKEIVHWRIDYQACHITWAYDGTTLREIKAQQIEIPYTSVRVEMGMFPSRSNEPWMRAKPPPLTDRSPVAIVMRVFRFRYIYNIVHDEPLSSETWKISGLVLILLLTVGLLSSVLYSYIFSGTGMSGFAKENHADYVLMSE